MKGRGDVEPETDCQEEYGFGAYSSSISKQASTLANDGEVTKTTISTTQRETEHIPATYKIFLYQSSRN